VCQYPSREIFSRITHQRYVTNVRWSRGLLIGMGSLTCKTMYGLTSMSAFVEGALGDCVTLYLALFAFQTPYFPFYLFDLICESP
jgi:hypothetical protein